jgi:hypothetical protein
MGIESLVGGSAPNRSRPVPAWPRILVGSRPPAAPRRGNFASQSLAAGLSDFKGWMEAARHEICREQGIGPDAR